MPQLNTEQCHFNHIAEQSLTKLSDFSVQLKKLYLSPGGNSMELDLCVYCTNNVMSLISPNSSKELRNKNEFDGH